MKEKEIVLAAMEKFVNLMYEWEKGANLDLKKVGDINDDNFYAKQIEARRKIFDEIVVDKKRKKGGIDDFSIGFPEKYNPELEKTIDVEVNSGRASVLVEKEIAPNVVKRRKYVFIKFDKKWILDDVYEWAGHSNKWILMAI